MDVDPALGSHTESTETGGGGAESRDAPSSPLALTGGPATHTPTTATSTAPKLTPIPSATLPDTPTFTSGSSSTPPKLTPTLPSPTSSSPTCKTLPSIMPMLLTRTPTVTSTPLSTNALTTPTVNHNPTPPTLTHCLPTPPHVPPPLYTPPTLTPTPSLVTSSCSTVSAITSPPTSSVTNSNMCSTPGTSAFQTNGNARPATTPTSPPITPFHTPASRQVPRTVGTPSLLLANQSTSPVRQRVSQQALLLGQGPCSSRDQMLLRAQMLIFTSTLRPVPSSSSSSSRPASAQLQSLTLRPSDPGALTIPPSLRLKSPSSLSSPVARPRTPLFPPLRPRPQPSAMKTDRQTTAPRHNSVAPPTLYPSVRSVPLRPRLHSPNGHRVAPPKHSPTPLPTPAVADPQALPSRQWTGPTSSLSPHTLHKQTTPGQSQVTSGSRPLPLSSSCFDRLPPASRQLQIIALSAGSTNHLSGHPRTAASTHPSASVQSKRIVFESPPLQLEAQKQRTPDHASPPPTFSSLSPLPSSSDQDRTTERAERKGIGGEEEGKERAMTGVEEEGERVMMEEQRRRMEVERGPEDAVTRVEEMASALQAGPLDPQSRGEPETQTHMPVDMTPNPSTQKHTTCSSEPGVDLQTAAECSSTLPYEDQQDLCGNMSTQSDNQSVLSSLSSQSPPASPFNTPPCDNPPPLLPVSPSHPETVILSQGHPESVSLSQREPWKNNVWPEGRRRVLTHLVEGFVIHEGLQAFPVTRSSLLLGGQECVSHHGNPEGPALLPLTDTPEVPEHSSESEREGASTDDPLTGPRERRGVLKCESCGKRGHAHSFHRSTRYCSTSCARRYNLGMSKRLRALSVGSRPEALSSENKVEPVPGKPLLLRLPRKIWSAHRHDYEEEEGYAGPMTTRQERRAARRARRASEPAMTPNNPPVTPTDPTPAQWSVEQVWDFIHTLPGCGEVAEAFRVQEIDGQALLLLTEDHLMASMNIKLGPALKICAHINALRNR